MDILGGPTAIIYKMSKRVGEEVECARGIRVGDDVTELVERGVPLVCLFLEVWYPTWAYVQSA